MEEKCSEIENLEKRDQQIMYHKVKDLLGRRNNNKNIAIKTADGKIAMDVEEVKSRWSEYIAELFYDDRPDPGEIRIDSDDGPPIMKEEVKAAITSMKRGKAVGEDGIDAEVIQVLGEFAVDQLTSLFQKMYESGYVVESLCESVFIALPKVEGTLECSKHCTSSIMSQITKILLRVLLKRLRAKIRPEIADEQFGFVAEKGTANALFTFRILTERALEVQKDVFACFVDYEKAFDKVRHVKLFEILKDLKVDDKDLNLLKNLYWSQKASVRVGEEISVWQEIKRGVRQGCVLSPDLFNIYSEVIMRELLELDGIRVGGKNVNNIRYADDTVLLADSPEKLQNLVEVLVSASEQYGLKINTSKTKVMVVSKGNDNVRVNVRVGDENLEQVEKYKYLGSLVTQDGRCVEDIKT